MRKRWTGYAAWLLLAACLYFFENNTGTRVILLCSALLPFIPPLRAAFFSADEDDRREVPALTTIRAFTRPEPEDSGEIRQYVPGDPVRRIHWKLSARKDELLVRDTAALPEITETEEPGTVRAEPAPAGKRRRTAAAAAAAGIAICAALLLLAPEANRGARELCNRLFAESEAVNSYVYRRFAVPENQGVLFAAALLLCAAALLAALAALLRSRPVLLGIMAACTLFQAYFGLSFPAWANIPLYGLAAAGMLRRPAGRADAAAFGAFVLAAALLTAFLLPGADPATEAASERVRDRLARLEEQLAGTAPETPEGETETRRIHMRSLEYGDGAAETEQEFRLVTEEEEQISEPRRFSWIRAVLLTLAAAAVLTLPFAPFLLLNERKRKAREIREKFASENVGEAVRAIFGQVIRWLEAARCGAGNRLYRDWGGLLPDILPEGYPERFARCAADYEEAAYSDHEMPEQKRLDALGLLEETETALWKAAGKKQRFQLKYWMCLRE